MAENNDLLHKIVQLRETSSDDYLYPITLIEAVKDRSGIGINQILNERLIELRESIDNRIDQTDQNVALLRSSKVSVKESLLSGLAVYYLRGQSQLDLSSLYNLSRIYFYYSEVEPSQSDTSPHYWMNSTDKSLIKYYTGEEYVSVEEDVAIFLYSIISDYLIDNGGIEIYVSTDTPDDSGHYNSGDVYLYINGINPVPLMYLSNRWVSVIYTQSETTTSRLSIDSIVDLVSIRSLSIIYSTTTPSSSYDIWYDGIRAYIYNSTTGLFTDPVSYSLDRFISSIFNNRLVGSTSKLFYGPATPRESVSRHDVWIDTRLNSIYINTGVSTIKWVEQTTLSDTITTLSIGNLFTHTDDMDSTEFVDYTSGNAIVGALISVGVRNVKYRKINADTSITQIVPVMSNTLYTIAVDANKPVTIDFDRGEILTSNVTTSSIDGYNRYYKTIYFDTGISTNTARITISGEDTNVAYICMQRGQSVEWVPKLSDILFLLSDKLNSKSTQSNIYIGGTPSTGSYNIFTDSDYSTIQIYNSEWNDLPITSGLIDALREIGSIYESNGVAKITTSHVQPDDPDIGDIWINDALVAMRWIGSSWGNTDNIIMGRYRTLSGTIQQLSDTQLRLAFAQTSQEIDDIVDQASALNQNIQVFKQDDTPSGTINVGDLWVTQTGVKRLYRWNGTEWTISGITRLMDIEADASGLSITIGGTTGTLGSTIGTAMTNASTANTTAQNALNMIETSTNMLTLDLSNDSVQIPTLYDGSGANYTNANTTVTVYHRGTNVSSSATISASASSGVTHSLSNRVVSISNMTTDTGYVDITATYSGLTSTIRFMIYKVKGGTPGTTGINGLTSYTFIRYSDYSDGTTGGEPSFDTDPTRPYIGIATILDSSDLLPSGPPAPTSASSYKWSSYKGTDGSNGISTALVYLYKRSSTTISSIDWTDSLTYDFTNRTLSTVPSGWYMDIPSGTNPLYVTAATARGRDTTDTIAYTEWSTPTMISSIGTDGTPGLNSATILLYKRSSTAPSNPTGSIIYTFSTGAISGTGMNGWTKTIPNNDGNPLYVIQATAISSSPTYTIQSSSWSTPVIFVEDGADGTSITILGTYNSLQDLETAHPTGNVGDAYIIQGDLYVWSPNSSSWTDVGRIKGDTGSPGTSSYLHTAYATSSIGTNFSTSWFSGATYIGVYVDSTISDSSDWQDYDWSLIKGDQGEAAVNRYLEISETIIKKMIELPEDAPVGTSDYTPSSITMYAKQNTGSGTPTTFQGYFKVGFSVDGVTYTYDNVAGPSSSYTKSIPIGQGYMYIDCILYYDSNATQQLDEEILTVIIDPDELVSRVDGVTGSIDTISGRVETTEYQIGVLDDTISNEILDAENSDSLISRVAALNMSIDEISLTVSDNYSDLGELTSKFSYDGLGLNISAISEKGNSDLLYDTRYIHLRYTSDGLDSSGNTILYGMSTLPTKHSRYIGFSLTSTQTAPNRKEDYEWKLMNDTTGSVSLYLDNDDTGTSVTLYWRYSRTIEGTNPTHDPENTFYIGLKIDSGSEGWIAYRNVVSPISTYYTADGIHFIKNIGEESIDVGSVTSEGFRLKNGIIEEDGFLRMGDYIWTPTTVRDGNNVVISRTLSFLYSPIED